MILLQVILATLALGLLVFIEFRIDGKIVRNPAAFSAFFIWAKHSIYSCPRFMVIGLLLLQYFDIYPAWFAAITILISGLAAVCLFRFWHDWLYQWLILTRYKKGTYNGFLNSFVVAFYRDSETPIKDENSFWDKYLHDTSKNRLLCLYCFCALTIIQIIIIQSSNL